MKTLSNRPTTWLGNRLVVVSLAAAAAVALLAAALLVAVKLVPLRPFEAAWPGHDVAAVAQPAVDKLGGPRDQTEGKPRAADPAALVAPNDIIEAVGVGTAGALPTPSEKLHKEESPSTDAGTPEPLSDGPPAGASSNTDSSPNPSGPTNASEQAQGPNPRLIETPIVTTRSPDSQERNRGDEEPSPSGGAGTDDSAPSRNRDGADTAIRGDAPEENEAKKYPTSSRNPVAPTVETDSPKGETTVDTKPENFQLPGSIQITVYNYKGTKVKWALLVIMDNSKIMGRKSKDWDPDKFTAAKTLIARLPSRITPGSRIAVRDFLCPQAKSTDPKASAKRKCLSRMLFKWDDAPFSHLKDQLAKTEAGGVTDTCAAAVHALKNDAPGARGLVARLLIITNGAKKCAFKEALRIAGEKTGDSKPRIDVAALGMPRKHLPGYAKLAEKTGGTVLRVERRADLDAALARYGALLTTPAMDKIEIRGSKSNIKIDNGQELTVAPGAYSIVLPPVSGLDPAHRTIKDVKIGSGENKSLNVKIVKGKPTLVTGKK